MGPTKNRVGYDPLGVGVIIVMLGLGITWGCHCPWEQEYPPHVSGGVVVTIYGWNDGSILYSRFGSEKGV